MEDVLSLLIANNNPIRQLILTTASVKTLAGMQGAGETVNGIGTNSRFNSPTGLVCAPDGIYALVADANNNLIRQIILTTASVKTLAGTHTAAGCRGNSQWNWDEFPFQFSNSSWSWSWSRNSNEWFSWSDKSHSLTREVTAGDFLLLLWLKAGLRD